MGTTKNLIFELDHIFYLKLYFRVTQRDISRLASWLQLDKRKIQYNINIYFVITPCNQFGTLSISDVTLYFEVSNPSYGSGQPNQVG